jgi:molecular chaperone DnaK
LFGKDPIKGIILDDAMAMGVTIKGGVLQGDVEKLMLFEITPFSLRIEILGRVTTKLTAKNRMTPNKKNQVFSTVTNG